MSISKFLTACALSIAPFLTHGQDSGLNQTKAEDPTTMLTDQFCGQTVTSWSEVIQAIPVTGATAYKFYVQDAVTGLYEELITAGPSFSLDQLSMALVPQNELLIRVAYRIGKTWYRYGRTCRLNPTFIETWCGFDPILDKSLQGPSNQAIWEEHIAEVLTKKDQLGYTKAPYIYTIPVVFHIVDDGSATGADFVSNADILAQLDLLNEAFEDLLGSANPNAADVQIRFCLAKLIDDGINPISTNWTPYWTGDIGSETVMHGVTRTTSTISNAHEMSDDALNPNGMIALSNHISFPYENYLNIWVVNTIIDPSIAGNVLGYSPYPLMSLSTYLSAEDQGLLDGVVVRASAFLGGSHPTMNTGGVMIHEVGHYLKLYHTWTDACHSPLSCGTMGDFCCDTPTQAAPDWNGCTSGLNTCDAAADPIDNHMSYSQEFCRNTFTQDQKDWMFACISLYRQHLVSTENLAATLPDCIDPLLLTTISSTSDDQICEGGSVSFNALPPTGTFLWSFPGGTPSTSTSPTPTVTYTSAGVYDVSVTVTIAGSSNVVTETQMVYVAECDPLTSNFGQWYYGRQAGLDFSSGIAQNTSFFVFPANPNNIRTPEAATALSDNAGNLVLYSDGNTIYDRNHAVMNGSVLGQVDGKDVTIGGTDGSSAHRGVIAFEDPNNINTPGSEGYYIFHTSCVENNPSNFTTNHGLGYSHVTVNSTFPNGTVDAINVRPVENYAISECVSAVSHCNGRDFWVVVQGSSNSIATNPMLDNPGPLYSTQQTKFFAYLVSPSGVATSPVASPIAPIAAPNAEYYTTHKFSPDGNILAVTNKHTDGTFDVFFYQFDRSTGMLTYLSRFDIPYNSTVGTQNRDLEFSPDGKVFYVVTDIALYQVDITTILTAPSSFTYTETDLDGVLNHGLQVGPDNRIYIAGINTNTLSIINFPNVMNTASWSNECGLNMNALTYDLLSKSSNKSFQNQARIIDISTGGFVAVQQNCFDFQFIPNQCGTIYSWDFGGLMASEAYMPTFTFPGAGSYVVTLNVDGHISTQTIEIEIPQAAILGNTQITCGDPNPTDFFASPNGAYTYQWTVTGGLPATSNLSSISFVLVDPTATIQLTVTDPVTGCSNTITEYITTDCCQSGVTITHPFKMNSISPGRSMGYDVELDLTQDLIYHAGIYSNDMVLGTHVLNAGNDVENFILQLSDENCANWMLAYPINVSTLTSTAAVSTYHTKPIKLRTSSTGDLYMASQQYGHSYIASIDPVTGTQTIIFELFNNSIPGTNNAIITDFVIDEANSRIVFLATINGTAIDFAPVFSGTPATPVFIGAISYSGTPVAGQFLSANITSTSGTAGLAINPSTGQFYATIQQGLNKSFVYTLSSAFVQSPTPFLSLVANDIMNPSDMEYDVTSNMLAVSGNQRAGTTSPAIIISPSTQVNGFVASYNFTTSTASILGLNKAPAPSGVEIISGEIIYQHSDATIGTMDVVYGKWNPATASNTIINTADFIGSIGPGGIDYNPASNTLYAGGYFFSSIDFGGTTLLANGNATTFYASKLDLTSGGYLAMGLQDAGYSATPSEIAENPGVTSIDELNNETRLFEIYPNPTNGTFSMVLTDKNTEPATIIIRDARGAILYKGEFTQQDGPLVLDSNQLQMSPGMYTVSVITTLTEKHNKLIVR